MFERLPLQQLHSDEVLTVRFVDLVNRADIRVIERRGGEGFPLEAFASRGIILQLLGQELQRDMTAQLQVLGLVDDAHAAATQHPEYLVVRDGLSDKW